LRGSACPSFRGHGHGKDVFLMLQMAMDFIKIFMYNIEMIRLITASMLIFVISCSSNGSLMTSADNDVIINDFTAPDLSGWDLGRDNGPATDISQKDIIRDTGPGDIHTNDTGHDINVNHDTDITNKDISEMPDIQDAGQDTIDIDQDTADTNIYAGLENLTGNALKTKLHNIVSTGYHSISYSEAGKKMKNYVDNYHGYVTGVYTGQTVPVSQANSAFNIEHTWPQSKGASGTAKSDIHHLYPTNNKANSSRGNLTFGYVTDASDDFGVHPDCTDHFPGHIEGCLSYLGKDKYGTKVFEPRDAHKGNVARAVLYFAIRYNKNLTVFDSIHAKTTEKVLKEWNHLDPPDDNERTRNDRIQTIQNNRNPFIDHPEFVDKIEFVQ